MDRPMICFCQGTYGERIDQTKECTRRIQPYVDRTIIIVDESVTEGQKQELRDMGCEVYFHPWHDDFVEMRNHYLEKVQTDSWVVVADPDEFFNEAFCRDVRAIIKVAEEKRVDRLCINSHDVTFQKEDVEKDVTPKETISTSFKNLIFRKRLGAQYTGKGEGGRVHEGLEIPDSSDVMMNLDRKYWYTHVKLWHEIFERAARNVFIGGGGINIGGRNPSWKPLREICKSLGMDNWIKLREYLRKGNIDPRLKEWLWSNRMEGWDYDHEEMEFGRWYFEYLYPEEATFADGRVWKAVTEIDPDSPPGLMNFVDQTYQTVLGRNADQQGKEFYTKAILDGQIRKEDLPEILKQSREFMQKMGPKGAPGAPAGETVRVQVPVNVDVRLSENLFTQALMQSETYWLKIKPRLDIGIFMERALGDQWKPFQEWFYSEEKRSLKQLIKKLREMQNA